MSGTLLFGGHGLLGSAIRRLWIDETFVVPPEGGLDITNEDTIRIFVEEADPARIINCAAWNDVDGAEENEEAAMQVNAHAVRNLARLARERSIPFVHFSTDYVFDGTDPRGYAEDAPPHPVNAYGRSKALGEQYARQETDQHYLIRTSRLYGFPPESSRAKKNFVVRIAEDARAKEVLSCVDEEPGAFTFADDVAIALKRLLDDQAPYGTYHLTAAGEATWFACAQEIVRILGLPTKVVPVPRSAYPAKRQIPPYTVLRSTKIPHLRPWAEALADFLSQYSGA